MEGRRANILLVTVRADYGGGPEHIYQLVRNTKGNLSYYIACPKDKPYWDRYSEIVRENPCLLPSRKLSLKALFKLYLYIKKNKINLIHTHGKGAGLYGRICSLLTGIPCIHTPHGIHIEEYGKLNLFLYRVYENISSKVVRCICFVSSSERQKASSLGLWRNKDYRIIPNGVLPANRENLLSMRNSLRHKLGIKEKELLVITMTRYDHVKNMKEALDIAIACPEIRFLWLGDGPERTWIESEVLRHHINNIIFLGFTDTPQIYLVASDVYLNTSRSEGLPIGILEAMSLELPVVATNVCGNNEVIVNNVTGFLYTLGDILSARDLLLLLRENTSLRFDMGVNARERQNNLYSVSRMVDGVYDLYRNILN